MKKTICFFIFIFILLLYSCSNSNPYNTDPVQTSTSIVLTDQPSPSAQILLEDNGYVRILHPLGYNSNFSNKELREWEWYMQNKYNTIIDIELISKNENDNTTMINVDEIKNLSKGGGLVYITNITQLKTLIDRELILPVTFIFSELDVYNNLSNVIISHFSDRNGTIWGLPLGDKTTERGTIRYYDKEILIEAQTETPRCIDDLYKLADYLKSINNSPNGEVHYYLLDVNKSRLLLELGDIFNAFGCFQQTGRNIGYNPQKEEYEICALNENFIEAMSFIKALYDDDLVLDTTENSGDGVVKSMEAGTYKVASTYNSGRYVSKGWSISKYLLGSNKKYLVEQTTNVPCFAVLVGTENPIEMVESFFNILKSDSKSWLDFECGIEDVSYTEDTNCYYKISYNVNGNYVIKTLNLRTRFESLGNNKLLLPDSIDYETFMKELEKQNSLIEKSEPVDEAVMYFIPLDVNDNRINKLIGKLIPATTELFRNILINNIPVETEIENYRIKISAFNADDIVEEVNTELKSN